jgi:hypothetical protein
LSSYLARTERRDFSETSKKGRTFLFSNALYLYFGTIQVRKLALDVSSAVTPKGTARTLEDVLFTPRKAMRDVSLESISVSIATQTIEHIPETSSLQKTIRTYHQPPSS